MKNLDDFAEPSPVPEVRHHRVLAARGITLIAAFAGCRSSTVGGEAWYVFDAAILAGTRCSGVR
jgi:hypothetical protein